jgi:CyaY protein
MMDDATFDKIADEELHHLASALDECDPDELEAELSQGVLTVSFPDGEKLIVNSHRAAGQIWMAAFRQAWHFTPSREEGGWKWRTDKDELRETISRCVAKKIGRDFQV